MQVVGFQIVILILIVAVLSIHLWVAHPTSPIKYLDIRRYTDMMKPATPEVKPAAL